MWNDGPIPSELTRYPGYLLSRLGHASSQRFAAALEPSGLHPRHFGVMTIVASQPGITQQGLHAKTAIDPSSMVAVIDDLERLGLAERRPHLYDRRARAIYLTNQGERTLKQLREKAAALQQEAFSALTARERDTLVRLLRKLADADVARRETPAAEEEPGAA